VGALYVTTFRKHSKFNLAFVDHESIQVIDVKHLPPNFNGDTIVKLPSLLIGISSAYGHSIDNMDNINTAIVMATINGFSVENLFKTSTPRENHHMQRTSLKLMI
jgi:hypothetical protein